jgi:hypothetical protein
VLAVIAFPSILYALRGQPAVAHGHADRCLTLSEQHAFRQWRGLSRTIRDVCTIVLNFPAEANQSVVTSGIDEYRSAGYQFGITVPYVLLVEALLVTRKFDLAREMIEQGLSICNLNGERPFLAGP